MDPTSLPTRPRTSALAWFVISLLACAAALNVGGILGGGHSEPPAPPSQNAGPPAQHQDISIRIPADTGKTTAKVLFEVFLPRVGACECHVEAALLGRAVGAIDPDRIQVAFRDLGLPETVARTRKLGAGTPCAGFAINAQPRFEVPSTLQTGPKTRRVDFLSSDRNWTMEDVYAALSQQFEKAYKTSLPIDREQFLGKVNQEMAQGRAAVVLAP
jgi:hypothetical protein